MIASLFKTLPPVEKKASYIQESERELLRNNPIPAHVAIIPDGNRRWAKKRGLKLIDGYLAGAQTLIRTSLSAKELGLATLTAYTFSTENWKRAQEEIEMVMELLDAHLRYYAHSLIDESIRLHVIGDHTKLPSSLQKTIEDVEEETKHGTALDLVIAINYGGRNELIRAFKKTLKEEGTSLIESLSEEMVSKALDTARWKDPDLIIRTSGEERLSNFLLWQSSYSEMYTEKVCWPDFSPQHLFEALREFQARKRRHGGDDIIE